MRTPLDIFEERGGEPWHITQGAYVLLMSSHFAAIGQQGEPDEWKEYHRQSVQEAMNNGSAISNVILSDYPNMVLITKEEQEARYAKTGAALNSLLDKAAGI